MGFFRDTLRKAQGLPTESETRQALTSLHEQITALQMLAIALDDELGGDDDVSLFITMRLDLANFALHIASSDNVIDQREVDAINAFLGTSLTRQDCVSAVQTLGLGTRAFNSTVPNSFLILTEVAKHTDTGARKFADMMIATYKGLGAVIAAVDGDFDSGEKADLDAYINMLTRYARTL